MSIEPPSLSVVLGLTVLALAYLRAIDILRGRGKHIRRSQQAWFWTGWVCTAVALIGPIDTYAGEILWVHMTQHILLADVAGPLLLIGLRTPVLVFFWPKPLLVGAARSKVARSLWHFITQPAVALTIWALTLYLWHVPVLYERALQSDLAHTMEHASFVLTGALVWWPLIDPAGTGKRSGIWKAGYLFVARTLSGALGVAMIVSAPWYESYIEAAPLYGLSPVTDQQVAGVIMMTVDFLLVTVIGIAFIMASFPSDDEGRTTHLRSDGSNTA